MFVCNYNVTTC